MYRTILFCTLLLAVSADLVTDEEQDGIAGAMHGGADLTASTPHPEETPLPQLAAQLFGPNETVPLLDMLVRLQVDMQSESELHRTFAKLAEYTKTQFGLSCNAFGGESACVSITRGTSDLARFCSIDNAQIDCMFYNEDMLDLRQVWSLVCLIHHESTLKNAQTPVDRFQAMLSVVQQSTLHTACPECLENLKALWCAQLRAMVESTASQHVPHIPLAWSRSFRRNITRYLPCRGMCKAVIDTCTCGAQGSMGAALAGLTAGASGVARDVLQQAIVADESDVDLCDWFSSDDYAGECTMLSHTCTAREQWCDKDAKSLQQLSDAVMLGSIIKTVFGWTPPDVHGQRLDEEIARRRHHPFLRLLSMGALAAAAYFLLRALWPMLRERMERVKSVPGRVHSYQPPGPHSMGNELLN